MSTEPLGSCTPSSEMLTSPREEKSAVDEPMSDEPMSFDTLSPEWLEHILSLLDNDGMEAATSVSKLFNARAITVAPKLELAVIKNFANVLAQNLPKKYATEKKRLLSIDEDSPPSSKDGKTILDAVNLLEVKACSCQFQPHFVDILSDVDKDDLTTLKASTKESMPKFFKKLFYDVGIESELRAAQAIPDINAKSRALREISKKVAENGDVDKAVTIANMIPVNSTKSLALRDIAIKVVQTGDSYKAITIANIMPRRWS